MFSMTRIFTMTFIAAMACVDANALMWNDPGIVPVQRISDHQWIDGKTGRRINITGMDPATGMAAVASATTTPTPSPSPAPAPSTTTTTPAPSTPSAATTSAAATSGASSSGTAAGGGATSAPAAAKKFNAKGAALGAAGVAVGTIGVVDSVSGNGRHTWGDVLEGTASGATAAAGGAAIINAIPVVGNIGYGAAVAVGAVVGGIISGSQLFSETDCLDDPVTGKFTCCHTQFNKGERYADIGDYMFCGIQDDNNNTIPVKYGVRQCLQGGSAVAASWWEGLWKDDAWSPECTERFCAGVKLPDDEDGVQWYGDPDKICWLWGCQDDYKLSGNRCIYAGTGGGASGGNGGGASGGNTGGAGTQTPTNPYDQAIQTIENEIRRIQATCGYGV